MPKYTTRIDLRDADKEDYERLSTAMIQEGFSLNLRSEDDSIFVLPTGTFNRESPEAIKEVFRLAEKAANSTGKKNGIVVSEAINRMWKLQEIFE